MNDRELLEAAARAAKMMGALNYAVASRKP